MYLGYRKVVLPLTNTYSRSEEVEIDYWSDGLRFHHSVQMDTSFLLGNPVLLMVYMATHFTATCFLPSQIEVEICAAIEILCTLVYVGPPEHLTLQQGTSYIRRDMRSNLGADGLTLLEAAVENPGAIGTVERNHAPL